MPLQGPVDVNVDDPPYFESIQELEKWSSRPPPRLNGLLPYVPRSPPSEDSRRGKLLVCHDYKGGYKDTPDAFSYTFNFWQFTDIFVYFSHHRVTVPPPGWVNASHRQGTLMLGTLIFEGSAQDDCLRLVSGPTSLPGTQYVSPHYARVLAQLAHQRGFDGYLLNFECQLSGGLSQSRALTTWVAILDHELKRTIGQHAECVWYDSVIIDGSLRWQNRLNSLNLPYFPPSSSFFTNYSWPTSYPLLTVQYFLSLDPDENPAKELNDIYFGVDVWGRGSHGGGGFGCYKAIQHIDPEFLGLSVALFGQAWTWETEENKPSFTWQSWWAYDCSLWLGPRDEHDRGRIIIPSMDTIAGTDDCVHGAFLPMSAFFPTVSPPNPMHLPFFTSFSPGVGLAWFVGGRKVFESSKGWTDVDKSTSLGNLVWPKPSLSGTKNDYDTKAKAMISMDEVWIGGSSLQVSLSLPPSEDVDDILWLPIQSLSITPQRTYKASIVIKVTCAITDLNFDMSVRGIVGSTPSPVEITKLPVNPLPYGWSEHAIIFTAASGESLDSSYAIGITLKYSSPCPCDATITFGSLSTYLFPNSVTTLQHHISLAAFERIPNPETVPPFSGTLTWNISSILPLLSNVIYPTSAEDPHPTWTVDATYPSFLYFNIYVQRSTSTEYDDVAFLGTTGFSGTENTFHIDGSHPMIISQQKRDEKGELESLRFWVQGVTDRGDVLSWDQCTSVEVQW